jgi:hypothetical protein
MQLAVPGVADLSSEPAHILRLYGADEGGSHILDTRAAYARNCILARRLVEKGASKPKPKNPYRYYTGGVTKVKASNPTVPVQRADEPCGAIRAAKRLVD